MTDLKIAKTLREGAQYIRMHGWCQETFYDTRGRVCAVGSLTRSRTLGDFDVVSPAHFALKEAVGGSIMLWNDAPGRTAAEVIDLLESVALQHELRALAEERAIQFDEEQQAIALYG